MHSETAERGGGGVGCCRSVQRSEANRPNRQDEAQMSGDYTLDYAV